jgi:DNA-binding transcriptional ArsR family regulator
VPCRKATVEVSSPPEIRHRISVPTLATRLDLSYSGVSQHLARLREAGFVTVRRDGKQRLNRADRQRLGSLEAFLESFWAVRLDRLATLAEEAEDKEGGGGKAEEL